jgi:hypothetical protein
MFTVYGLDGVGIWFTADVPENVLLSTTCINLVSSQLLV